MPDEMLCSFMFSEEKPITWKEVYDTIIEKLGPEVGEWSGGITFEGDVVIINHRDKKRQARVQLVGIEFYQSAVAGGLLTALRKARGEMQYNNL